jgi:hypothetical protein
MILKSDTHHQCTSFVDGDEIVFKCPLCMDYERRINLSTGKMVIKKSEDNHFLHIGVSDGKRENVTAPLCANINFN